MTYQISEKNQILIALFAIVVLCAGKLFKDYLFRRGYVEGMSNFTTETNKQMRRDASSAIDVDAEVYLYFTLDRDLEPPNTIIMASIITGAGVAFNSSVFTATVVSGTTAATFSTTGSSPSAVFTPSEKINAGSKIKIKITNIRISPGYDTSTNTAASLRFTITPGNEAAMSRDIKILPALSSSTPGQYTAPTSATSTEIQAAITGINARLADPAITTAESTSLLKARSALVTLMASTYGTIKEAGQVFESGALYEAQRTAIDFIDKEKKRAASNATALKEDNSNKRRMAQVNTYYTRNYEANTEVMKNIIFISVALIILAILRNKELIPSSMSTLGVIFVLMLGGVVIGSQVFDIIRRNDHDFDKYDWTFNEKEQNDKKFIQTDTANLSELGMGMAPCFGSSCCDVGTSWDENTKKCIPDAGGRVSGSAGWNPTTSTLTITLKVPGGLQHTPTADTVDITLPPGLFSGSSLTAPSGFSGTPDVSRKFTLTKTGTTISAAPAAATSIVITGLTVEPNAYSKSKQLTVKTSKDINLVGIDITGIPPSSP